MSEAEAAEVAGFVNDCWRVAYAGILDAGFLDGLTTGRRETRLRDRLARGAAVLVARDETGRLVGMVQYGPSHLIGFEDAGLIGMLYLREDHIGTGLGRRLLADGEAALRERGYTRFVLDAFTANANALGFYEAHGWVAAGSKEDLIGERTYHLTIMTKDAA